MSALLSYKGIEIVSHTKGNQLYGHANYVYIPPKQHLVKEMILGATGSVDKVLNISYPAAKFNITWYVDATYGIWDILTKVFQCSNVTSPGPLVFQGNTMSNYARLIDRGDVQSQLSSGRDIYIVNWDVTFQLEG